MFESSLWMLPAVVLPVAATSLIAYMIVIENRTLDRRRAIVAELSRHFHKHRDDYR